MPRDQEESNRFLGMPLRTDRQVRRRPESQRVLGFPLTGSTVSTSAGFRHWRIRSGATGNGSGAGA
jgi:hypothetical protein